MLDGREILIFKSCVYALEEDLYGKKFYKADLHIHSTYSDGCEAPELVVASARECGMDIIAVTDHNSFEGSLDARKKAKEFGLDMTVLTGIEYAMAYSPMHILSIGAEKSVDRSFLSAQLAQSDEAATIIQNHPNLSCDGVAYACTQILLDEIQKLGGIIVLAHPYWKPVFDNGTRMDTPESLFVELAKEKRFTGYEIVSGSPLGECHVSHMQASFMHEMEAEKTDFPILGITDSHHYTTDGICGKHFTVIISDSREEEDILEALRRGQCVAVEIENGKPLCYGKHRLNKLAMFLVNYYFPARDRQARLEALSVKEKYLYNT
jgi:PHP family Zn ribbon phosphoesterase